MPLLVEELSANNWQRLRDIRLAALRNDGHAFGGNLEVESEIILYGFGAYSMNCL